MSNGTVRCLMGPGCGHSAIRYFGPLTRSWPMRAMPAKGSAMPSARRIHRTLAFFCHGGVIAALLSHLLYIPLPVALPLFQHDTAGFSLLRSAENDGHGVFRMVFLNSVAHKDVAEIARHP